MGADEQSQDSFVLPPVSYPAQYVDPNFASYALPPPVFYANLPTTNARISWAERITYILGILLLVIYFIHFCISVLIGAYFGLISLFITSLYGAEGLIYLLEWLFPLGFFFKVVTCILALIGMSRPSKGCLIASIVLGILLLPAESAYGIGAAIWASILNQRYYFNRPEFLFVLILCIFTFICLTLSLILIVSSTIVLWNRRNDYSTGAVVSVPPPTIQI